MAFESDSDFLGQGILDNQNEIWLFDTGTMTYTRITTASDSNRDSLDPSLSADGTVVAFRSDSDLLGQGILDDQYEIWLYDTTTMTYTRVTTASDSSRASYDANLSADGSVVAFRSDSDILNQSIPDDQSEIWLYDTLAMTYTRVTTASNSNRASLDPFLSADGSIVAFESDSDLLGQGVSAAQREIWLYDTTTMTYTRVTTASAGNRDGYNPVLSTDGKIVAFTTDSDILVQGIPDDQFEIWLYDTEAMTYTRITYSSDSNRSSDHSNLSADGSTLAFYSDSDFLGGGIPDNQFEVWTYDIAMKTYTHVTNASETDRDSFRPQLSADGSIIAFHSDSDFLGDDISDNQNEIWLAQPGHSIYLPLVVK
jgi:hypothetical protein